MLVGVGALVDNKVGVDVKFPARGVVRPVAVNVGGVAHKITFHCVRNIVYHVVLENNRQALLSWDVGSQEWTMREIDN